MAPTVKELFDVAATLPLPLQTQLAEKLVLNVESKIDPELEKMHLAEVARRLDDYRAGNVKPIEGATALRRVRKTLGK